MENIMKSLLKLLGLASVSLFATSHADTNASTDSQTQTQAQVITPSAGPRVENAIDGIVTADFIYFHAAQTGLDYATNNLDGTEAPTPQGSIYYPNFQFDAGFRIGLGLDLAHDGWDVISNYTYLHTGTHTTSNTFETVETVTVDNIVDQNSISAASSKWRLKLDVIDLDLGRNYFISQYLALRPFFGAKAAWNRQKFNATGTGFFEDLSDAQIMSTLQDQTAFGIGLRTGMNSSWQFTKNWNIYGNVAFTALSSTVHNLFKTKITYVDTTSDYLAHIKSSQNVIQPVVELAMGFGYDCYFNDDNYHFGIQAGWEFQYWNNNNFFNQVVDFSDNDIGEASNASYQRSGDLSLQGFDLRFRLDF